jgi:Flp pilus assembly pilin Flp
MKNVMLPMIVKAQVWKATRKAQQGQGVIEYAGALVIAAVLVAAVINIGPDAISGLFTDILNSVKTSFQGKLPT